MSCDGSSYFYHFSVRMISRGWLLEGDDWVFNESEGEEFHLLPNYSKVSIT